MRPEMNVKLRRAATPTKLRQRDISEPSGWKSIPLRGNADRGMS